MVNDFYNEMRRGLVYKWNSIIVFKNWESSGSDLLHPESLSYSFAVVVVYVRLVLLLPLVWEVLLRFPSW